MGVVFHLQSGEAAPALIHKQPGGWSRWYESHVLATTLSDTHREAYLRVVHTWLLESILALPGRLSFKERTEAARRRITGAASTPGLENLSGLGDGRGPPGVPGGIGGGIGIGDPDDVGELRGQKVRWVNPKPELRTETPWKLTYASTDGIPVEQFDAVRREVEQALFELGSKKIQRVFGPDAPSHAPPYPEGVSERLVKTIFRSRPIGWTEGKDAADLLRAAMVSLMDHGIHVGKPLRVYTLPSGRVAVHPKDHTVLAAMNLLHQAEVPTRLVLPPFEWQEEEIRSDSQHQSVAKTSATESTLVAARKSLHHAVLVEQEYTWKEATEVGLEPFSTNQDLWSHVMDPDGSAWIPAVQDVGGITSHTPVYGPQTIFFVRPEGGLDVNVALGYDFAGKGVALPSVNPKNVLGAFLHKEKNKGTFAVHRAAHKALSDLYELATSLTQINLFEIYATEVPKEQISLATEELRNQGSYAPPLLMLRNQKGRLSLLSSPLDVHALRGVGVATVPAAVIDWNSLRPDQQTRLTTHYGVGVDGTVHTPLGTQDQTDSALQDLVEQVFPSSKSMPTPIELSRSIGEGPSIAVAIVDDFTAHDGDVQTLKTHSSQGPRHASILLSEIGKQSRMAHLSPDATYAIGYDIGDPDKATPGDVVNAIRASIEERRLANIHSAPSHSVMVISLSPKLRYNLDEHFVGVEAKKLTQLQSEMKRRLEVVIAEAARAGIIVVSGAEPEATLSNAIVEAGAKTKQFLSVAGTDRMSPNTSASSAAPLKTPVDFLAPGIAPVFTHEGIILENAGFVPVAITAATAIVGFSATVRTDFSTFQPVETIMRETRLPSPGSQSPGQLSPLDVHLLTRAQFSSDSIQSAKKNVQEKPELNRPFRSAVKATHVFVVHHDGGPRIEEVPPLSEVHLGDTDELVVYSGSKLQDVVSSDVWNQGLATGDIQVVKGDPAAIRFFGGYSLQSAGQKFRFPDHGFTYRVNGLDEYFLSTDPILAREHHKVVKHRDAVKPFSANGNVRRLLKGQEVSPSSFPKGVTEFPVSEILRSEDIRFETPRVKGGRTLKEWLTVLTKTGIDVEKPIHVYSRDYGLVVWPPDQPLLAAMNLLGETQVPVRLLRHPNLWWQRLERGEYKAGAPNDHGVSELDLQRARKGVVEAHYVLGPKGPVDVFKKGLPADGHDINLWNHIWNTGANSAWITAFSTFDEALVEARENPQYYGEQPTYYLVRFQAGVSIERAIEINTYETAVPSIRPRDVLAAVTAGSKKGEWNWTINSNALDPLPKVAEWTHSAVRQPFSELTLPNSSPKEIALLTDSIADQSAVVSPLVVLKSKSGGPQILTGGAGALALKTLGYPTSNALVIKWESLNPQQQKTLSQEYFHLEPIENNQKTTKQESITFLEAPRFDLNPAMDNMVFVRYDERLFSSSSKTPAHDFMMLISAHSGETLRTGIEDGPFSGDFTTVMGALAKKPGVFSVSVIHPLLQHSPTDLSLMQDRDTQDYRALQKKFGKGALPRMAAGWKRVFAYLPVGKNTNYRLSKTTTFEPKTVPMTINLGPPKMGSTGHWKSFNVEFGYPESGYWRPKLELYFAKVAQRAQGPQDYIVFEFDVGQDASLETFHVELSGPQTSVAKGLSARDFFRSFQSGEFELWTSARTIRRSSGQYAETPDLGPTRESTPVLVDFDKWLTP